MSRTSARKTTGKFPEIVYGLQPFKASPPPRQYQPINFIIDPKTLLFETHKSEDVSVLRNSVSLIEIHEVLMHLNMKLLPLANIFHIFTTIFMFAMIITLILTIWLLVMQDLRVLKPVIGGFFIVQIGICLRPLVRKMVYKRVIHKFLKTIDGAYRARGLIWRVRSVFLSCENRFPCWLELVDSKESVKEPVKTQEDLETKTFVKENRSKDKKVSIGLKTAWNLTLGPNASRNVSFNAPTAVYTMVDQVVSPNTLRRDTSHTDDKAASP